MRREHSRSGVSSPAGVQHAASPSPRAVDRLAARAGAPRRRLPPFRAEVAFLLRADLRGAGRAVGTGARGGVGDERRRRSEGRGAEARRGRDRAGRGCRGEERGMRVAAAELNQNTKSIRTCRWRLLCRLERRPCLHDVPLT